MATTYAHPPVLLADIGGTYARIAPVTNTDLSQAALYKIADFKNAAALFTAYEGRADRLIISAAGHIGTDGIWRIDNHNNWEINPQDLTALGFKTTRFVPDFIALARGVLALPPESLITLRAGLPDLSQQRIIAGAGTGIGLAIATPLDDGQVKILRSHGGHNLAVAQTHEQHAIVNIVRELQGHGDAVCFEDICSGRGLPFLYQAVARHRQDTDATWPQTPDLATLAATSTGATALRLFHEFFGYYLQTACITGHGAGGIYLDGGLLQSLHIAGLLDADALLNAMGLCHNQTVKTMLDHIPVYLVNSAHTALYGLKSMVQDITDHG